MSEPRRDYRGLVLCDHCWNGSHWRNKVDAHGRKTEMLVSTCEQRLADGHECECPCRQLLAETEERRKASRAEYDKHRPSPPVLGGME